MDNHEELWLEYDLDSLLCNYINQNIKQEITDRIRKRIHYIDIGNRKVAIKLLLKNKKFNENIKIF